MFNWGDPTSQALAPVLKGQNMPFVAFTSVADVTKTSPYTIRAWNRPEDFASSMWTYLRSKNLKNIAVVKVENLYLNSLLTALTNAKKSDEKVTLIDNYVSFGDKDFRTSISKIKQAAYTYDVLGVYLASGQIGQFYKQAKEQSLTIPTFGTDFFESQSAYAGNVYDVVMIMNKIDLSNKDSFMKGFESIKNFNGVLGSYNYSETTGNRYLASPIHIKLINNGGITATN